MGSSRRPRGPARPKAGFRTGVASVRHSGGRALPLPPRHPGVVAGPREVGKEAAAAKEAGGSGTAPDKQQEPEPEPYRATEAGSPGGSGHGAKKRGSGRRRNSPRTSRRDPALPEPSPGAPRVREWWGKPEEAQKSPFYYLTALRQSPPGDEELGVGVPPTTASPPSSAPPPPS